jgi:hypothetical protein
MINISFPNSFLVTFSLANVARPFAYRFWKEATVRQVVGFLARIHFFCQEPDLALLRGRSPLPDRSTIGSLFPSGTASLTIQMTRKLISVNFRYTDREYNFNDVFTLWFSSDDRFKDALTVLGKLLLTPPAFVKIIDRKENVMLPYDDIKGSTSLHPDPYTVRVVSNTVFYRFPRSFWFDKVCAMTYSGLITCDIAQNYWCEPLKANDPSQIRLVFHEKTLLRPDNLAYLESKQADPILVTKLGNFHFQIGKELITLPFSDVDTVGFVQNEICQMTRRSVRYLLGYYRSTFSALLAGGPIQFQLELKMESVDPAKPIHVHFASPSPLAIYNHKGSAPVILPVIEVDISGSRFLVQLENPVISVESIWGVLNSQFLFMDTKVELFCNAQRLTDVKATIPWKPGERPVITVRAQTPVFQKLTVIDRDTWHVILDQVDLPLGVTVSDLVRLLGRGPCSFFFRGSPIFEDAARPLGSYARGVGPIDVQFHGDAPPPRMAQTPPHVEHLPLQLAQYPSPQSSSPPRPPTPQVVYREPPPAHAQAAPCPDPAYGGPAVVHGDCPPAYPQVRQCPSPAYANRWPASQQRQQCPVSPSAARPLVYAAEAFASPDITVAAAAQAPGKGKDHGGRDPEPKVSPGNVRRIAIGGPDQLLTPGVQAAMRSGYPQDPLAAQVPHAKPPHPSVPDLIELGGAQEQMIVPAGRVQFQGQAGKVRCNLILPPDDRVVSVDFNETATVSDAIARALQELSDRAKSCQIEDGDSNILPANCILKAISEPRDLFVAEFWEFTIESRGVGKRLTKQLLATSTVEDLERQLSGELPGCKYANRQGLMLQPAQAMSDIEEVAIAVPAGSQGSIRVQLFDLDVMESAVDLDAPAIGLLDCLCAQIGMGTQDADALDGDHLISPNMLLQNVRGTLRYVRRQVAPQPSPRRSQSSGPQAPHPQQVQASSPRPPPEPAPVSAHAVPVSDIHHKFGPDAPKRSYTFVYDEDVFDMDIPDAATVGDTKEFVAEKYSSLVETVKLLYCGKELKDRLVLSKQRITPPNRIVVYIREMNSIILQSVGAWRSSTAPKPPDYVQRLAMLAEESGQDSLLCMRAYLYFNYDYDKALQELRDLAP